MLLQSERKFLQCLTIAAVREDTSKGCDGGCDAQERHAPCAEIGIQSIPLTLHAADTVAADRHSPRFDIHTEERHTVLQRIDQHLPIV